MTQPMDLLWQDW